MKGGTIMPDSSVAKRDNEKNLQTREDTRASERYITPAVDIIETDDGLTLIADIPGAAKDTLNVTVEQGIMTINAPASRSMPGQSIYTEFEIAHYYRQFSIPETLNNEKSKADYKNGQLILKVPVSEAAKPRKIKIKVV